MRQIFFVPQRIHLILSLSKDAPWICSGLFDRMTVHDAKERWFAKCYHGTPWGRSAYLPLIAEASASQAPVNDLQW
jgi:hypothetical protein